MKFKRLLAIALSVMVMFTIGAASGVFAAGENSSDQNPSYNAGEAKLVKYFKAPLGITLPNETFTFNFVSIESDASDYATTANSALNKSATIALADMTFEDQAESNNKVGTLAISDIFPANYFPHAGEYTFTVSESNSAATEGMTYSTESYTLRIIVKNTANGGTAISDVTVEDKDGNKVDAADGDPTDNTNDDGDKPTAADSLGGFTFTNTFIKTVDTHKEPVDPNPAVDPENYDPANPPEITPPGENDDPVANAFELDKFVLGQYGDKTMPFEFTVTVQLPELAADYNYAAQASTALQNGKVSLADSETFSYAELPIGTKITIAEADVDGYTKHWDTSANNSTTVLVGEDGAYVICRNAFNDESVTPTGIIINNLPYILLILLAVGGIVLFARKRRYQ